MPAGNQPNFSRNRKRRIIFLTSLGFFAASGGVYAIYKTIDYPVQRDGRETRVNVIMSVPYGTMTMAAGAKKGDVALLQMQSGEEDMIPFHVRYSYNPVGTTGTLRMTIGSDEGMLETNKPLAQGWKANSNYSLARTNAIHSDYGDISPTVPSTFDLLNPAPFTSHDESDHAKIFLTRDIPLSISAQLGFGESVLDWTGLALTCAYVETGSAKTQIHVREHNQIPMVGCKINAGFGEFTMDGISDLNTDRFEFSGGIGYYSLNFNGTLTRNLDATVEVGLGKVAVNIPPEAARVQIYYNDSYFSSFSFSGLTKRSDGYYTSVGFDQSKAPILTLHLSSGLGKMIVNYH
ncbi:MAG: hypothetical protein ACHQM6_02365 [Candidatus Kapaibacterium sp.]